MAARDGISRDDDRARPSAWECVRTEGVAPVRRSSYGPDPTSSRPHSDRSARGRSDSVRLPTDEGPQVRFFPDQIFHLRGLSSDGIKGLSPIQLAREAIGLGMSAEEYASRFFSNDSTPPGVLKHPGSLSEPAQKRIRESWEGIHGGTTNAHKIGILEEGMAYERIGVTPRGGAIPRIAEISERGDRSHLSRPAPHDRRSRPLDE